MNYKKRKGEKKWFLLKPRARKDVNYTWLAQIMFLNKQDGYEGETKCALVERNCVLFYLVIVLREGNQTRFELFSEIFLLLNAIYTPVSLMGCKEIYNLSINRASLDRVHRTRATPAERIVHELYIILKLRKPLL